MSRTGVSYLRSPSAVSKYENLLLQSITCKHNLRILGIVIVIMEAIVIVIAIDIVVVVAAVMNFIIIIKSFAGALYVETPLCGVPRVRAPSASIPKDWTVGNVVLYDFA